MWQPSRSMKKPSRKTCVRNADHYASLYVRLAGRCVHTDGLCSGKLECGHLFSRVAYSTRWSPMNLYCLCSYHNIRQEDDPMIARALLEIAEEGWGKEKIEELHRIYEQARPVKTFMIEEYAHYWQKRYEEAVK